MKKMTITAFLKMNKSLVLSAELKCFSVRKGDILVVIKNQLMNIEKLYSNHYFTYTIWMMRI